MQCFSKRNSLEKGKARLSKFQQGSQTIPAGYLSQAIKKTYFLLFYLANLWDESDEIVLFLSRHDEASRFIKILPGEASYASHVSKSIIPDCIRLTQLVTVSRKKILACDLRGLRDSAPFYARWACYHFIAHLEKKVSNIRLACIFTPTDFFTLTKMTFYRENDAITETLRLLIGQESFFFGLVNFERVQIDRACSFLQQIQVKQSSQFPSKVLSCGNAYFFSELSVSELYTALLKTDCIGSLNLKLSSILSCDDQKQIQLYFDEAISPAIDKAIRQYDASLVSKQCLELDTLSELSSEKLKKMYKDMYSHIEQTLERRTEILLEEYQKKLKNNPDDQRQFIDCFSDFLFFLIAVQSKKKLNIKFCDKFADFFIARIKENQIAGAFVWEIFTKRPFPSSMRSLIDNVTIQINNGCRQKLQDAFVGGVQEWNTSANASDFLKLLTVSRELVFIVDAWRKCFSHQKNVCMGVEALDVKSLVVSYQKVYAEISKGKVNPVFCQPLEIFPEIVSNIQVVLLDVKNQPDGMTDLESLFKQIGECLANQAKQYLEKIHHLFQLSDFVCADYLFKIAPPLELIMSKYKFFCEDVFQQFILLTLSPLIFQAWNASYKALCSSFSQATRQPRLYADDDFFSEIEKKEEAIMVIRNVVKEIAKISPGWLDLETSIDDQLRFFLDCWKGKIEKATYDMTESLERDAYLVLKIGAPLFSEPSSSPNKKSMQHSEIKKLFSAKVKQTLERKYDKILNLLSRLGKCDQWHKRKSLISSDFFEELNDLKNYLCVANEIARECSGLVCKIILLEDGFKEFIKKYTDYINSHLTKGFRLLDESIKNPHKHLVNISHVAYVFSELYRLKNKAYFLYREFKRNSNLIGVKRRCQQLNDFAYLLSNQLSLLLSCDQYNELNKLLTLCANCFLLEPYTQGKISFREMHQENSYNSILQINKISNGVIKWLNKGALMEAYGLHIKLPDLNTGSRCFELENRWCAFIDDLCDNLDVAVSLLKYQWELVIVRDKLYPKLKQLHFIKKNLSFFLDRGYARPRLQEKLKMIESDLVDVLRLAKNKVKLLVKALDINKAHQLAIAVYEGSYYMNFLISELAFCEFSAIMSDFDKEILYLFDNYEFLPYEEYIYQSPKHFFDELIKADLQIKYKSKMQALSERSIQAFDSFLSCNQQSSGLSKTIFTAELILGCLPMPAHFICQQKLNVISQQQYCLPLKEVSFSEGLELNCFLSTSRSRASSSSFFPQAVNSAVETDVLSKPSAAFLAYFNQRKSEGYEFLVQASSNTLKVSCISNKAEDSLFEIHLEQLKRFLKKQLKVAGEEKNVVLEVDCNILTLKGDETIIDSIEQLFKNISLVHTANKRFSCVIS